MDKDEQGNVGLDPEFVDRLLKADEVAELFQVPASWIYRQAGARRLPSIKMGRYLRFEESAVRDFIEAHKRGGKKQLH